MATDFDVLTLTPAGNLLERLRGKKTKILRRHLHMFQDIFELRSKKLRKISLYIMLSDSWKSTFKMASISKALTIYPTNFFEATFQ